MTGPVTASDVAAEQAVLGCMMMSPQALASGLDTLRAGDFWRPAHAVIFEAMAAMDTSGVAVDAITLREHLDAHPENGKYGGGTYLHDLLESVPSVAQMPHYAGIVTEAASRRALAVAGTRIVQVAGTPDTDAGQRADQAGRYLEEATQRAVSGGEPVPLGELLPGFLADLEAGPDAEQCVPVYWSALRPYVRKLRPGELVVVGGRPGTGKTSVLLGFAAQAAIVHKIPTLFQSLEMTSAEIVQRLVSAKTRVPLLSIRNRTLTDGELRKICDAIGELSVVPLLVNDDPYPRIGDIRGHLRMMRRRGADAGLLCVDYLQLMTGTGAPESRQVEVSEITRGMKLTAKEFRCSCVAGSQLNRSPEGRSDKRPLLGDLRESGATEQDADIVLLLYRDKIYHPDAPGNQVLEMTVAKQRNGPTGVVKLSFKDPYASVENLAADAPSSPAPPPPPPPPPARQAPPLPYRPTLDDDGPELGAVDRQVKDP